MGALLAAAIAVDATGAGGAVVSPEDLSWQALANASATAGATPRRICFRIDRVSSRASVTDANAGG